MCKRGGEKVCVHVCIRVTVCAHACREQPWELDHTWLEKCVKCMSRSMPEVLDPVLGNPTCQSHEGLKGGIPYAHTTFSWCDIDTKENKEVEPWGTEKTKRIR